MSDQTPEEALKHALEQLQSNQVKQIQALAQRHATSLIAVQLCLHAIFTVLSKEQLDAAANQIYSARDGLLMTAEQAGSDEQRRLISDCLDPILANVLRGP